MKINNYQTSPFETNADISSNNTAEFKIGDSAIVIEILRNRLYSHPIRTCVQEYLCNGRDACREAGREEIPLQVTIPTYNSPVFKVRDFGLGISPERMNKIFVYYGASTKRSSNKQTGGFGIGAKSAWAYTDSFIIVTYVDGIEYQYAAYISNNNNGEITLLSTKETDKPNGTEIQIPVKTNDISEFKKAVFRATMFWDIKPEIVNAVESRFEFNYSKVSPIFSVANVGMYHPRDLYEFFEPSNGFNPGIVMVIDGIPYQLESNFRQINGVFDICGLLKSGSVLTIHVDNGDVEVSASREKVSDSEFSKKKINEFCVTALKNLNKYKKEKAAEAKNLREFIKSIHFLKKYFKNEGVTSFNSERGDEYIINNYGELISRYEDYIELESYKLEEKRSRNRFEYFNSKKITSEKNSSLYVLDSLLIYNDCPKEKKSIIKEKIKAYLEKESKNKAILVNRKSAIEPHIEIDEDGYKDFIDNLDFVLLSSLERPVKNKEGNSSKDGSNENKSSKEVDSGLYIHRIEKINKHDKSHNYFIDLNNIGNTRYVYIPKNKNKLETSLGEYQLKSMASFLKRYDIVFCGLTQSSIKKIEKNQNFITLSSFLEDIDQKILNDVALIARRKEIESSYDLIKHLDDAGIIDKLDDEKIKQVVSEYKKSEELDLDIRYISVPDNIYCSVVEKNHCLKDISDKVESFKNHFKETYKVFKNIPSYYFSEEVIQDLVEYMNLKYRESLNKKENEE